MRRALSVWTTLVLSAFVAAVSSSACTPSSSNAKSDTPKSDTPKPDTAMSKLTPLDDWIELRDLSPDELRAKLAITDAHIATDRTYERLTATTQWRNPSAHPGYFIFHEGKLAVIYVDDEAALEKLDPDVLEAELGPPDAQLRSRAGKRIPYNIYGAKGLAIAADSERVHYLEIFAPTTAEVYRTTIYDEPPPYRK